MHEFDKNLINSNWGIKISQRNVKEKRIPLYMAIKVIRKQNQVAKCLAHVQVAREMYFSINFLQYKYVKIIIYYVFQNTIKFSSHIHISRNFLKIHYECELEREVLIFKEYIELFEYIYFYIQISKL